MRKSNKKKRSISRKKSYKKSYRKIKKYSPLTPPRISPSINIINKCKAQIDIFNSLSEKVLKRLISKKIKQVYTNSSKPKVNINKIIINIENFKELINNTQEQFMDNNFLQSLKEYNLYLSEIYTDYKQV